MMNIVVLGLLLMGLLAFLGGTVGILRFPDIYTRLHAAGKLDSLGSFLMMLALALYNLFPLSLTSVLTSFKMLLFIFFLFVASPTATHALVDAGVRAGLTPWTRKDYEEE